MNQHVQKAGSDHSITIYTSTPKRLYPGPSQQLEQAKPWHCLSDASCSIVNQTSANTQHTRIAWMSPGLHPATDER